MSYRTGIQLKMPAEIKSILDHNYRPDKYLDKPAIAAG